MEKEELYLRIVNHLQDGVYVVDTDRKILFWNKAAEEITGYRAEEIVGKCCAESKLDHIDENGIPLCCTCCPLFATLVDGEQRQERVFVRHKEGYRIPVRVNIFPIQSDGVITGAVEIFTRDSPTVYEGNLIEQLSDIAMHDNLTQLPNRRYLESFLHYKLSEFQKFGRLFAVLFADIDNFSHFNNTYGHDLGDRVLINIASSIEQNVRRDDLIGRWGGEEFVGIYTIGEPDAIVSVGEKFRQAILHTEVSCGESALNVSMSIGVTAVRKGDTAESILERADRLMYQSKHHGKDKVTVG